MMAILAITTALGCGSTTAQAAFSGAKPGSKFKVSFSPSIRSSPVNGRVLVIVTANNENEPRFQVNDWDNHVVPVFGTEVVQLKPGVPIVIDSDTSGFPIHLGDLPSGDYSIQAILNVYTECRRSDGHDVWVHLDQWEGQQPGTSPGNLISEVQKVHLDANKRMDLHLSLSKV